MENEALTRQYAFILSVESESKKFLIKLYELYHARNSQIPVYTVAREADVDKSLVDSIIEHLVGEGYVVRGGVTDNVEGLYVGITIDGAKKVKELIAETKNHYTDKTR